MRVEASLGPHKLFSGLVDRLESQVRMLGSLAEAEADDAVQEARLRLRRSDATKPAPTR
ncbi:hypothetical protein ACIHCQ_08330 [Streptomyces sp. NPDC052236]|uniref:hypothetical protein n=1 Tax=Streptomyces sp. NPDC052236 TaxID=3365686 RepID=UPI0037D178A1